MIKHSFIFLEKIREKKERRLWAQGIADWNDFLKTGKIKSIAPDKKSYYDRRIQEAQQALLNDDPSYFIGRLPAQEMWRMYDYFKDECCFLDVETDSYGKLILVGISNYFITNTFVQGVNLERNFLEKELQKYKLLVTFNGSSFDLPKLKKQFQIVISLPHIDLKPLCARVGLPGGLKEVEKSLNLKRPAHLRGNPVDLWKALQASGDREYLDLLIDYNKEDIENLKGVMEWCYKNLATQHQHLFTKSTKKLI